VSYQKAENLYREEFRTTPSDAVFNGKAGWVLDEDSIIAGRMHEVDYAVIWVKDRGEIYVTAFTRFTDPATSKTVDWGYPRALTKRVVLLKDFMPPLRRKMRIR